MKKQAFSAALMFGALLCAGQQIEYAEYFVDIDPGFGMAHAIAVPAPGNMVSLEFTVDAGDLDQGFHMMVIRVRDDLGRWSTTFQHNFYVYVLPDATAVAIDRAEYFIDLDPGFGMSTPVEISDPGNELTLSLIAGTGELSQGFHTLMLRVRDRSGNWSLPLQQIFYVFTPVIQEDSEVSAIEYFIDEDPGFGMGRLVEAEVPGSDVTFDLTVFLGGLESGDHVIYLRGKDRLGRWSHLHAQAFSLTATAVGEMEVSSWFRLYPNPGTGDFMMEFSEMNAPATLTVSDLEGRILWQRSLQMNEVSGDPVRIHLDLPDGMFHLNIRSGTRSFAQRLIISR